MNVGCLHALHFIHTLIQTNKRWADQACLSTHAFLFSFIHLVSLCAVITVIILYCCVPIRDVTIHWSCIGFMICLCVHWRDANRSVRKSIYPFQFFVLGSTFHNLLYLPKIASHDCSVTNNCEAATDLRISLRFSATSFPGTSALCSWSKDIPKKHNCKRFQSYLLQRYPQHSCSWPPSQHSSPLTCLSTTWHVFSYPAHCVRTAVCTMLRLCPATVSLIRQSRKYSIDQLTKAVNGIRIYACLSSGHLSLSSHYGYLLNNPL